MTKSAWAWIYKKGLAGKLDGDEDARRKFYGIEAIKQELSAKGYPNINLGTGRFGGATDLAVKDFQKSVGLTVDGQVGPHTANGLLHERYASAENAEGVPRQLLRAHCHWESADDPGAELVNTDFSRDRGLTQANDKHDGIILSDDEAFTPSVAVPIRAKSIATYAAKYGSNVNARVQIPDGTVMTFDEWDVAVSAHRTPVGAGELAKDKNVVVAKRRQDGGTWEEAAAYYCFVVNTGGRSGWVG